MLLCYSIVWDSSVIEWEALFLSQRTKHLSCSGGGPFPAPICRGGFTEVRSSPQPRTRPAWVRGAASGTGGGPGGAAARGSQRERCGLGWQPGREEGWRLAASLPPPRARPASSRALGQAAPLASLLPLCVSSGSDLVISLGRNRHLKKLFYGDLWFCKGNCSYFPGPFTKHFLIRRCVWETHKLFST